jgi:hypothetical protein
MDPIKDTILEVMKQLDQQQRIRSAFDPSEILKNVLTKKELGHIKVDYFKNGTLMVQVDSAVWLYAVSLKKAALLKALAERNPEIKELRLRVGQPSRVPDQERTYERKRTDKREQEI